jgi:flagellar assembly protein FliH
VILAVEIARKVIGREIQLDPELVAETVRRAVELVLEKQRLTIRLHPKDAELVAKAFPEVESTLEGTGWVVKPDESVDRGGAVIHTEHGELDARIEAQLTEIARALSRRESEGSA